MKWRVIDGRPCPASIAPYVYIVLRDAKQTANAIYRGEDQAARVILHAHGGHTQAELEHATPEQRRAWGIQGTPNPAGRSMHELRSDGVAKPGPVGRQLEEWEIGVDSGGNSSHDKRAINRAAARHGWTTYHPYSAGVEGHHWGFKKRPRPNSVRMRLRIIRLRATLPRR